MRNEILLRKPAVLERTGMTNSTLYYFINEGSFPKPVKLGKRTVAWKKSEIDEWIDGLERSMNMEANNEEHQ
jgi:prophage regulatory protein